MVTNILKRKILTPILSSLLFSILFSLPDGFGKNGFLNLFFLCYIFSATYGVVASFISDWVSNKLFSSTIGKEISSLVLHLIFGSVFFLLSLTAAALFFLTDRVLRKVEVTWRLIIFAVSVVVIVFVVNII